ncbi:MAG: bi-domain-containing oxidoreductase [Alphaproteobacteria bacterium]
MKQIIQSAKSGKLVLIAVPEPKVRPGHLLVRNRASLICADTGQVPRGHSAAGEVVALGKGTEGAFHVGQRVAIAGAGIANHADINLVPVNLAAPVPDDVNDEEACFGALGASALHGVRNMGLQIGDCAAVVGAGLVGQMAAQLLELSGVRVAVFDTDAGRLELARYGRAELAWNLGDGDPGEAVLDMTGGRGCDGVMITDAVDTGEPFALAAAIARDRARVCLVGIAGTELPYRDFMRKELSVVVSRAHGPGRDDADYEARGMKYPDGYVPWTETRNLEHTLRIMSRRKDHRLAVEPLITHRFPFEKAEDACALVTEKSEPHLGVVLTYGARERGPVSALRVPIAISGAKPKAGCVLGALGAGTMLLPHLKGQANARLHTIAIADGISAEYSGENFGFEYAVGDEDAVLGDDDINAVLIATPPAGHAGLTAAALAAGKNVLVETPLALDRDELNRVIAARNRSDGFLMVGVNRRFAPMAVRMRDRLAVLGAPKVLLLRINAGPLPPEGQDRLLGEICPFVDLARFLIGVPIVSVQAMAAKATRGACDDVTATLGFTDGSLATIAYTAKGDSSASKELIEAYAGGAVITIDDFRSYRVTADGKTRKSRPVAEQDKGHAAELGAFVDAVAAGGTAPVAEAELIECSLATIAIAESLRDGASVTI